jgi:hypothetical protein
VHTKAQRCVDVKQHPQSQQDAPSIGVLQPGLRQHAPRLESLSLCSMCTHRLCADVVQHPQSQPNAPTTGFCSLGCDTTACNTV